MPETVGVYAECQMRIPHSKHQFVRKVYDGDGNINYFVKHNCPGKAKEKK